MNPPTVEALRGPTQTQRDHQFEQQHGTYLCEVGLHPEPSPRRFPAVRLSDGRLCCPHCAKRDGLLPS